MYNKFFGFLVAFLFVSLSVFAQDAIPKIDKEKLREDSINAIVDKSIDKIDGQINKIDDRINKIENRVSDLKGQVDKIPIVEE